MSDTSLQLLSIARERWAFSSAGLVRLLDQIIDQRIKVTCVPSLCCNPACSCASGSELPILFTKFSSYLVTDAILITRPLLLKSCVLCAEMHQLLQRTLNHAHSLSTSTASQMPFEKFGSNLRSIVCSVFHLLLQIVMQTDESVHGSCSCAALLHELLLLAHFLHTCLTRPAIKSSYSACTTFAISASIKSFVACDNIPSMTLPQRFSDALFERCQDNLRRAFTSHVNNTETLHMLLTAARLLQLLSSASAALCPTPRRSLPTSHSLNSLLDTAIQSSSNSSESSSSDDASMQLLIDVAARVCNLTFGVGTGMAAKASELHLFAECLLPLFVVTRDRASCGTKEFITRMSVHSNFVTQCMALADCCMRASCDSTGSSSTHASAAFAFFRALGPMVGALPSLNKQSVSPDWIVASIPSETSCDTSIGRSAPPDGDSSSYSSVFLTCLEKWRSDPHAHMATGSFCGAPLAFAEYLKNYISAWILRGSGGGLRGLIERHAAVLSSTEQFADNLHRTLHFCANECHPSAPQPGMEYCAAMLSSASLASNEGLSSNATDIAGHGVFDGVARYFAHGLSEDDITDSLDALPASQAPSSSRRISLHLDQVLATSLSFKEVTSLQLSAAAAANFIVALCQTHGTQRKTIPLVPLPPADRNSCNVGLGKIWEHAFAALMRSEACGSNSLLLSALTRIIEHDFFYSGSLCQGIKEINLLQPASLVHNMIFSSHHALSFSQLSRFLSPPVCATALLADARAMFSNLSSSSLLACDCILHRMYAVCVLSNKVFACAVRRTDCIDVVSIKLSALWTDDPNFDAELWKPHAVYEFVCSELMPFLLQFASAAQEFDLQQTLRFRLEEWCPMLLMLLSNVNLIRHCPPCRSETEMLFSGIFPLLDLISDSAGLQLAVRCLADVVSISLQPAVASAVSAILSTQPLARVSAALCHSSYEGLLALCRKLSCSGAVSCQIRAFVLHFFRSFNTAMAQQRAATAKVFYSSWQYLSQRAEFKKDTYSVEFEVQAEVWPVALSHRLIIDSAFWLQHLSCLCAHGLQQTYALAMHYAASVSDLQTHDVIVETIASLVTFATQNLAVNVASCSLSPSNLSFAQELFFNTCEFLVQHLAAAQRPALCVLRSVLLQSTSVFSAASCRTVGPPIFFDGLVHSAAHILSAADDYTLSHNSSAVQFEDHPVFGKDLEMQMLFTPPSPDKKKDSSMLLSDAIRTFLRENGAVLPLLLSYGLSLNKRDYCYVPKNCKPSLLQWLQWLASSPHDHDASCATIAHDILLLLPDLDNFFTINLNSSSKYRSMKQQILDRSVSQSIFESTLHSIVDSSFYTSPSLAFLDNCAPNGKFALFRPAYIMALSLPSDIITKSFSFLFFLLGRPGQRVNMSNLAVQEGLFASAAALNGEVHSKLQQLIKLILLAADFENPQSAIESSPQIFMPKSGAALKVSLLVDFLQCAPCLMSMLRDLTALEFMLYRPPHADFDTLQVNFHCIGFLKDLFNHAMLRQSDTGFAFSSPVKEVAQYVNIAEGSFADLGDWRSDIGSVVGPSKFMWLVNSRLVIYLQRHAAHFLSIFASLVTKIDPVALPANISTLCRVFGCFFRLLALILNWKINLSNDDALQTCVFFADVIVQQKTMFQNITTSSFASLQCSGHGAEGVVAFESVRAVTHVLSLLAISHSVSASEVSLALLKILQTCEDAGAVALSDSIMKTIAKVCSRAVGFRSLCASELSFVNDPVSCYLKSSPTQDQLTKTQQLVVAVCKGSPVVFARCAMAISLLEYMLPLCPWLPVDDRKSVQAGCIYALQLLSQSGCVAPSFTCRELFAWRAAAELAHSLLQSSTSNEEVCRDADANAPLMKIVPHLVQSVVAFLRSPLVETPRNSGILSHCCDSGIKLLHSAARFACGPDFSEVPSFISDSFLSLLQSACDVDLSCVDSRNDIAALGRNAYRSRWTGIANVGNTCYAAVVLQQLASIPCFVASLFDASLGPLASSPSQTLLSSLQAFCTEMLFPSATQMHWSEPHELYSRCMISSSNVLHIAETTAQSQDAAEFFVQLINQLNAETSASSCIDAMSSSSRVCATSVPVISSAISELFAVSIAETFDWPACGCTRVQTEDSIVLPSAGLVTQESAGKSFSSIDAALLSHFSTSSLQRCCNCGSDQTSQCIATKRISRTSKILFVQLRCDSADGAGLKIFQQPSFPLVLDFHHVSHAFEDTEYDLAGIVLHHGLNMSTGHYTALVRDAAAADLMWGWHMNDARAPEPVSHSIIHDISSREGKCIDLENSNLIYSGKPYLLVYVRRQQPREHPARALVSGNFFDICKIAANSLGGLEKTGSESMQLQVLLFCLHVAPACVRLAHSSLRRLLCLFADTIHGTKSHVLDALASKLLSATSVTDTAIWVKSMIPFYLMNRKLTRGPELHSAFLLPSHVPFSVQDYSPSKLGSHILVALVSAAHVLPPAFDCACDSLVNLLHIIASQTCSFENKSSELSESARSSFDTSASSRSIACASAHLQPARILAAARAAASALVHFNRILSPVSMQDAGDSWLVGLAEASGVERVCQYLERSGAVGFLVSILQDSENDVGFKRSRGQIDSELAGLTVWEQLVLESNWRAGAFTADAEWF